MTDFQMTTWNFEDDLLWYDTYPKIVLGSYHLSGADFIKLGTPLFTLYSKLLRLKKASQKL